MATVSLLAADQAADVDVPTLDAGQALYGQVLNTWAAILHSPGLFSAYLPFLRQVNGPGALEERVKELVAVRVAVLNHCLYTSSHRCTSARGKGIVDEELTAVGRGDFTGFGPREQAALHLATEMTTTVPIMTRPEGAAGVSAGVLRRARECFDDRELVELMMSISMWNALSRFHRVMDFALDMPAPPAAILDLL
jgi:AhpD family alkylhydroperoxidase